MWLFTVDGMYSIVEKGGKRRQLCVRARDGADLDRLRSTYLPKLGPTITDEGTDYPVRAYAPRAAVARAASAAVKDIGYSNFKDESKRSGASEKRLDVLHKVWAALLSLEPVGAWQRRFWDVDEGFWDDEPIYTPRTFKCWVCQEAVPLLSGELDGDMDDDEELLAETNRIGMEIMAECEYNDTGHHYGQTVEEVLAA